tara:strand:+ start:287 stop:994 length:708 start_codon:yes stop_codon:yes gene_type:complete
LKFLSYSVHLFTVSGVIFSLLALIAAINKNLPLMFFYLASALFVDGIDGTLARKVDVKKYTPNINGEILDNIIDFLNYVFVPSFVIFWLEFVPKGSELIMSAIILTVSCYTFANNNIKTSDFYFSGFPALWNVVILYFYILNSDPLINLVIILFFAILTFIPIKFLHPFRVKRLRKTSLIFLLIWMISTVILLYYNHLSESILNISFLFWTFSNLYFLILTIYRTLVGKEINSQA